MKVGFVALLLIITIFGSVKLFWNSNARFLDTKELKQSLTSNNYGMDSLNYAMVKANEKLSDSKIKSENALWTSELVVLESTAAKAPLQAILQIKERLADKNSPSTLKIRRLLFLFQLKNNSNEASQVALDFLLSDGDSRPTTDDDQQLRQAAFIAFIEIQKDAHLALQGAAKAWNVEKNENFRKFIMKKFSLQFPDLAEQMKSLTINLKH